MTLEPRLAIPNLREFQEQLVAFRKELGIPEWIYSASTDTLKAAIFVSPQRVQRRIDALRVVEAIRHYAATHDSQLPDFLAQITDPPIPDDFLTGKPFRYSLVNGVATLSAPGFANLEKEGEEYGAIRYRIELRQKSE